VVVTDAVDRRVCCAVDLGHWLVLALVNPIFTWNYAVEGLHNIVRKVPAVVAKPTQEGAVFAFTYLSFTGSGMLIAAIISGFMMGFSPGRMIRAYGETIRVVSYSLNTISAMLAICTLTRFSGIDATLGLAFAGRRSALSVLWHLARMAGGCPDGLGYRFERAVRWIAEDYVGAVGPVTDSDGCGQFLGRRDGQDDRCAVDRRRLDRDQLVRARRLDPALCVLPFDCPRLPGRLAGHVAGLCLHRYDRALIATHKIFEIVVPGRPPRLGMTVIDGTGEIYSAACGVSCTELGP